MPSTPLPLHLARKAARHMHDRYMALAVDIECQQSKDREMLNEMYEAVRILDTQIETRYAIWQALGGTSDIHSLAAERWTLQDRLDGEESEREHRVDINSQRYAGAM
jgi:hypothetical protein